MAKAMPYIIKGGRKARPYNSLILNLEIPNKKSQTPNSNIFNSKLRI
jgi:hypothetical protein